MGDYFRIVFLISVGPDRPVSAEFVTFIASLGPIFIVAIVISSVNAVRAYRIVKRTGSGSSDLLHSKDKTWKKNKAYTIAVLALWGALCVGMIVFLSIYAGYIFSGIIRYGVGSRSMKLWMTVCLSVLTPLLVGAVVVSVLNAVRANKIGKKIEATVSDLLLPKEESVETEIEAYEKRHSEELLDALNEKLSSLGMDPFVAADLERTDLES